MTELENNTTFERVSIWNSMCGKNPPDNTPENKEQRKEILLNQLLRIQEELIEAIDAVELYDDLEALDAACDLDVTISGFAYLLGVKDYTGAINAVLENNNLKFYDGAELTEAVLYNKELNETGVEHFIHCTVDDDVDDISEDLELEDLYKLNAAFTIHRKYDDKIIKKQDHQKVELGSFL